MRPPTSNPITQGKHGQFNAVDYSARPDPGVYAPEDWSWHSYLPLAGDAGNNLRITGANGRHGFCHLEEIYIKPGQSGKKGDLIAKMGYTGLTIPKGPNGRHLHWVLLRNGIYVYPPSLITEPFGGSRQQGDEMADEDFIVTAYKAILGVTYKPTDKPIKDYLGKSKNYVINDMYTWAKNNKRDYATVAAKATEMESDLSVVTEQFNALKQSKPTGQGATPKQLEAEAAMDTMARGDKLARDWAMKYGG